MEHNKKNIHYCKLPKVKKRVFDGNISPFRERAIINSHKKWANGTTLKYYFFDHQSDGEWVYYTDGTREWKTWKGRGKEKETVRQAFEHWKSLGIGLNFVEVMNRNNSDIRIGFMKGDNSWSYLGRSILDFGINQRTMNFGWNIENDLDTALHEIGHTLGFPHEHQNPNAGIVWDEEKVYEKLAEEPNEWDRDETYHNILRKIPIDTVQGSNWDPDSIMHYPFEPGLIKSPEKYNKNGLYPAPGLSKRDIQWVKFFYPEIKEKEIKELKPAKSSDLSIPEFGQQRNFRFKPNSTRKFNIQTFGEQDGVMVLFKKDDTGELTYLSADDDSGKDENAAIQYKLLENEEYIITYRQYYHSGRESAIMIY